ncbi:MAG: type II toxin-antitoxin system HipA family toxin YjjJ [bacterium]
MPGSIENIVRSALFSGAKSPRELQVAAGISQPTLSRVISTLRTECIKLGKARATRYALLRDMRGLESRFPVTRIDEQGTPHAFGVLQTLHGGECWWLDAGGRGVLQSRLPWYIENMRPGGFLGRILAEKLSQEFGMQNRPDRWSADDLLFALFHRGENCPGNLIVGNQCLERFLRENDWQEIEPHDRGASYPALAQDVLSGNMPGSSATGEQPKFTCLIGGKVPREVLVKFSPPANSPAGRRWADLLLCEHLALQVLGEGGIPSARSEIIRSRDRIFLEVERFDRVERRGRIGVATLDVIDAEYFGRLDTWVDASFRFSDAGLLSRDDAEHLRILSAFGSLIGNTDQHFGNISLFVQDDGKFTLAPAYDVLPMALKPGLESVPAIPFSPTLPRGDVRSSWSSAFELAQRFWQSAAKEKAISPSFRRLAQGTLKNLTELKGRVEQA